MRDLFRGYYKPTPEEFAEIWKSEVAISCDIKPVWLVSLYRERQSDGNRDRHNGKLVVHDPGRASAAW